MANINRSTRNTNAATNLADNITNDISPADVRQSIIDINDSTFSLLDDYATNTFVGVLTDAGGTATYAIGTNNCRYTRILNVVYFSANLSNISTIGAPSGQLRFSGFPTFGGILNICSLPISRYVASAGSTFYSIVGELQVAGYIHFIFQNIQDRDFSSIVSVAEFSGGSLRLSGFYFVTP